MMATRPIFMAGCQSSGTTILARVLRANSQATFGVEDGVFRYLIIWLWWMRGKRGALRYARFGEMVDTLAAVRPDRADTAAKLRSVFAAALRSRHFQTLLERDAVLAVIRFVSGHFYGTVSSKVRMWGDKYPEYVFQLNELNALYPDARFIFVVRNPASVTASLVRRRFVAIGENANKVNLNEYRVDYSDCWKQWVAWNHLAIEFADRIDPARVFIVRYEDLLEDRTAVLERLGAFIGLDLLGDAGSAKVVASIRPERVFDVGADLLDRLGQISNGFAHPLCERFDYRRLAADGVEWTLPS